MEQWDRVERGAAYGAALALLPYLMIKVSWVVGSLLGLLPIGDDDGLAEWVALNSVTIGMAAIGIALALALVRPWGLRIPSMLFAFCAWVGSGFLVSVLPFIVINTVLKAKQGGVGAASAMPDWEATLIQASFLGTGIGLALAIPAYVRRRWPDAFRWSGGDHNGVPWSSVLSGVIGLAWLYWALGGTVGISQAADRDANWQVLGALSAFWAIAASAGIWMITRNRPTRIPRWLPLTLVWIGSGSLFAWSAWKLPLTLYVAWAQPNGVTPPEHPAVAAVLYLAAVVAGVAMLRRLVKPVRQIEGRHRCQITRGETHPDDV